MGRPLRPRLTDLFAVQDDVTRRIVGDLKVTLSPAENARLTDSGTSSIDAYDCAHELLGKRKTRETFKQSKACFLRAIELDPNYARAITALGFAYMFDYQNRVE
jgi:adenylate cyclase